MILANLSGMTAKDKKNFNIGNMWFGFAHMGDVSSFAGAGAKKYPGLKEYKGNNETLLNAASEDALATVVRSISLAKKKFKPGKHIRFISGGYGFVIPADKMHWKETWELGTDFDRELGEQANLRVIELYRTRLPNFAREAVRRYVGKKAKVVLPGETAPDGRKPPELPADYGVSVWIDLKDVDPSKPVPMFAAPRRKEIPDFIRGKEGNPVEFYHGTRRIFENFRRGREVVRRGSSSWGFSISEYPDLGVHFALSERVARNAIFHKKIGETPASFFSREEIDEIKQDGSVHKLHLRGNAFYVQEDAGNWRESEPVQEALLHNEPAAAKEIEKHLENLGIAAKPLPADVYKKIAAVKNWALYESDPPRENKHVSGVEEMRRILMDAGVDVLFYPNRFEGSGDGVSAMAINRTAIRDTHTGNIASERKEKFAAPRPKPQRAADIYPGNGAPIIAPDPRLQVPDQHAAILAAAASLPRNKDGSAIIATTPAARAAAEFFGLPAPGNGKIVIPANVITAWDAPTMRGDSIRPATSAPDQAIGRVSAALEAQGEFQRPAARTAAAQILLASPWRGGPAKDIAKWTMQWIAKFKGKSGADAARQYAEDAEAKFAARDVPFGDQSTIRIVESFIAKAERDFRDGKTKNNLVNVQELYNKLQSELPKDGMANAKQWAYVYISMALEDDFLEGGKELATPQEIRDSVGERVYFYSRFATQDDADRYTHPSIKGEKYYLNFKIGGGTETFRATDFYTPRLWNKSYNQSHDKNAYVIVEEHGDNAVVSSNVQSGPAQSESETDALPTNADQEAPPPILVNRILSQQNGFVNLISAWMREMKRQGKEWIGIADGKTMSKVQWNMDASEVFDVYPGRIQEMWSNKDDIEKNFPAAVPLIFNNPHESPLFHNSAEAEGEILILQNSANSTDNVGLGVESILFVEKKNLMTFSKKSGNIAAHPDIKRVVNGDLRRSETPPTPTTH